MNSVAYYIRKLSKLKRASYQREKAPHKPVLLLAILRLIETGVSTENKIFITPELVAAFRDYWQLLVTAVNFTANFSLPFYHLKSEGFWHLHTYPGKEILLTPSHSIKSFGHLKEKAARANNAGLLVALKNLNIKVVAAPATTEPASPVD